MKKVLSMLLVCVMLLSFALVANAAGEGYTIANGNVNASTGRVYLSISTKEAAGTGVIYLHYDTSKVTLMQAYTTENDDGDPVTAYRDYESGNYIVGRNDASAFQQVADTSKGNLCFGWSKNGGVAAGTEVVRIWFRANDLSADTWNADTFTVITSLEDRNALSNAQDTVGSTTAVATAGQTQLDASAFTWNYTNASIPGSTPDPEPDPDPEPSTWDGFTGSEDWTSKFTYPDADGVETQGEYTGKRVVAFGKNASGAELVAETYGITVNGFKFPGIRNVPADSVFAIVLIDTSTEKLVGDAYTYSIWWANGDAEAAGSNAVIVPAQ